jgi:hypothetical protein
MKKTLPIFMITALLLAACGQPAKTAEPSPVPASTSTAVPEIESVTLNFGDMAQVELVTPTGRHVYIDVYNTSLLMKTPSAEDILLTTHLHDDHYYRSFVDSFPGQQIFTSTGKIELPDVTVTGLASAHNAGDPLLDKNGTNYIYIIDTAGLRIVHFGDIGQDALTNAQLTAIGSVDVAITQFSNSFSNMNATNLKGLNLMDQVKPRLIIPTHSDNPSIKLAVERWTGYYSDSRMVSLSTSSLPPDESILFLGNLAVSYGAIYKLQVWK